MLDPPTPWAHLTFPPTPPPHQPYLLTPIDLSSTGRRLQVQTVPDIAKNTTAIRSLDWDRDRFDIEFALTDGTTYNSYLIVGPDAIALVDASHEKFRGVYVPAVKRALKAATGRDDASINHIIVSHTEPDHSGLVADVLDAFPGASVVASKVALTYLAALVRRPFASRAVKSGETLDLGGGHVLSFINAPNLHWPDTVSLCVWSGEARAGSACVLVFSHPLFPPHTRCSPTTPPPASSTPATPSAPTTAPWTPWTRMRGSWCPTSLCIMTA